MGQIASIIAGPLAFAATGAVRQIESDEAKNAPPDPLQAEQDRLEEEAKRRIEEEQRAQQLIVERDRSLRDINRGANYMAGYARTTLTGPSGLTMPPTYAGRSIIGG